MGTSRATRIGDALFGRARQRVLAILFANPDRSFYANELIRLVGAGTGAVQRELARFEAVGLVSVGVTLLRRRQGRRLLAVRVATRLAALTGASQPDRAVARPPNGVRSVD